MRIKQNVLILIGCWRRVKGLRWALIVLLVTCYIVSLVPVLTFRVSTQNTEAERFLYLPSACAWPLLVHVVTTFLPAKRVYTTALLLLVVIQAVTLQWVNQRWIIAAQLSNRIAKEVSRIEPSDVIILNLPDNYRGAYVFRNGLDYAATVFQGRPLGDPYRLISVHDVHGLENAASVRREGTLLTVSLPDGARFREVHPHGFEVRQQGQTLTLALPASADQMPSVLSFSGGDSGPMLQRIP